MLERNVRTIATDPALRIYGAALSLVNGLAALHWLVGQRVSSVLDPGATPVCWPIFPRCEIFRVLSPATLDVLVLALLLASVWNAKLFMRELTAREGFFWLLALTSVKYFIVLQDFRLTLNHHYMSAWIALVFFFAKEKRQTLVCMLVAMYLWAGLLKLDPSSQWLSGAAFYGRRPLGLPSAWIPAACAYVILLELVIVFGLFSRKASVFWSSFLQIVLFHIASFWVVGWFYPTLMFLLLSVFVVTRENPELRSPGLRSRGMLQPAIWLAALSLFQLPRFLFPGASALTGEGRLFALNMFDAPMECRATLTRVAGDGTRITLPLSPAHVNTRTMCEPLVYAEYGRRLCRNVIGRSETSTLAVVLQARRTTEPAFRTLVDIPDFCALRPSYSLVRHNPWIVPLR